MRSSLLGIWALAGAAAGCIVHTGDGTTGPAAPGEPLAAQFSLTWVTRDVHTGLDVNCRSVGADTVRVTARNARTSAALTDLFDCSKGGGRTYSLTAGDYDVAVDLVWCGEDPSCQTPTVLSSAPSVGPISVWYDGTYDLGDFVFLVQ